MTIVQIKNKILSVPHESLTSLPLFIIPPLHPKGTASLTFIIIYLLFFIAHYFCIPKQRSWILPIFELHINGSLPCILFCVLLFYSALYICESHPCWYAELNSFICNCYLVSHLNIPFIYPCYCYWTLGDFQPHFLHLHKGHKYFPYRIVVQSKMIHKNALKKWIRTTQIWIGYNGYRSQH